MANPAQNTPDATSTLLSIGWKADEWSVTLTISVWLLAATLLGCAIVLAWRWLAGGFLLKAIELDQAEIGIGAGKFRFKPNLTDRQVAYAIWVELSTRKIGLEIDFDHDVIAEIYDSWYNYFSVTRELIKGVSVSQIKHDSTRKIIKLSIEVLNEGLRPHLTHWQARFRHWYDRRLRQYDTGTSDSVLDPQQIQSEFPKYAELKLDMERVNKSLIKYRKAMYDLVMRE